MCAQPLRIYSTITWRLCSFSLRGLQTLRGTKVYVQEKNKAYENKIFVPRSWTEMEAEFPKLNTKVPSNPAPDIRTFKRTGSVAGVYWNELSNITRIIQKWLALC